MSPFPTPEERETTTVNGIAGVREAYGEGPELDSYVRMLKATRSFINVSMAFFTADEGSELEADAGAKFQEMIDNCRDHPDKAAHITESLAAIVCHLVLGGTLDEWFEGVDDHKES